MAAKPDRSLRWNVLEYHLDEAVFLWKLWERALDSVLYTFPAVAGLEWRLQAHLSALAAGGRRVADRLLQPALSGKDLDQVRAAASALLLPGEGQDVATVARAHAHGKQASRPAIMRALELSGSQEVSTALLPLLDLTVPFTLAPAIHTLAFRRAIPGATLARLLNTPDPAVASAALRAARFEPGLASAALLEHALQSTPAEQESALITGLVSGYRSIWRKCCDLAALPGPPGRMARTFVAMGGDEADVLHLVGMLRSPALTADVLWALGFSGRVSASDACLPWMEHDDRTLARLAGEAFSAITGLSLTGHFIRDDPEHDQDAAIPLEDDLATRPTITPESDLPLPEPDAVSAWWQKARQRLDPAGRHLAGRPFDLEPLADALLHGPARRRHPLALELAIRSRGAVQVETRAFAAVQSHQLDAAEAQRGGSSYTRPFPAWMTH
jgi:uncharacterized protein (TIGR02270 family)